MPFHWSFHWFLCFLGGPSIWGLRFISALVGHLRDTVFPLPLCSEEGRKTRRIVLHNNHRPTSGSFDDTIVSAGLRKRMLKWMLFALLLGLTHSRAGSTLSPPPYARSYG